MKRKTILLFLVLVLSLPISVSSETSVIKIMDIEKNQIIAEKKSSPKIEEKVKDTIASIKNIAVEVNPIPDKGYLIRIPLMKPLKIKNKWYDDITNEVIIIYSKEENFPHKIILFTDDNKPVFFDVNTDLTPLINILL
ncbi:hypothetical protein [Metabacillus fastidiosus]|uniref:hypothetical protein n=1 Tax=Metabacillus fastidiosus TaxID=1458 RepID=UPI002DB77DA6|nr:hypothetical protein [Metabacillus fastidiosus]MEC2078658.1 hypothetical protein [Metabacillus fastidiosus]